MSVNLEQAGGAVDLSAVDQHIVPDADNARDLGALATRWRSAYFRDTIYVGGTIQGVFESDLSIVSDGDACAIELKTPDGSSPGSGAGNDSGRILLQTGQGGNSLDSSGGNSGPIYISVAAGGSGVGNGGSPGFILISIEEGGDSSSGAGGSPGDITLQGGDGGNATAGVGNGGNGSNIKLITGVGGTSAGGSPGADGVIECTGNVVPEADGTRDLGIETTGQWANVWADAINGADFIMANGVRMLEAELYGRERGFAIGYSERWQPGKAIWHGSEEEKQQWMTNARPWLVVTDDAIEIHGRRLSLEKLDRLLAMLG